MVLLHILKTLNLFGMDYIWMELPLSARSLFLYEFLSGRLYYDHSCNCLHKAKIFGIRVKVKKTTSNLV